MSTHVNRLVVCPYDPAHKLKENRMQYHISKCKMNHLSELKKHCPFNFTHLVNPEEYDHHMMNCPDRGTLDRRLAQNLDKNNPYKGNTAVPASSSDVTKPDDECWDTEIDGHVTFDLYHKPPPPNAIIEPPALSTPSERKKLYSELRGMYNTSNEHSNSTTVSQIVSPRQPRQLSETQKLQNAQVQQMSNAQAMNSLGFGRGRAQSRLAANFDPPARPNQPLSNTANFDRPARPNQPLSNAPVSGVTNGMAWIGLGRGQPTRIFSEDDFPSLGGGRQ